MIRISVRQRRRTTITKILLIEDNSGDIDLISEMLSDVEKEYTLKTADRLSSGLKMLEEDAFDVVLLDLTLPDSSGIDTLRKIQGERPNLPIVVLTGLAQEELATQSISLGAQDYLVKGKFEGNSLSSSILYSIERKRLEVSLRQLNRRNELILATAGEGILGLDREGRIIFLNSSAARMFGYTIEEMTGKNCRIMYHHSRPDGTAYYAEDCPIDAAFRQGTDNYGEEVFWRKDGTSFPVDFTSKPLYEENRIVGAVVTFRDITERKQAEETRAYLSALVQSSIAAIISLPKDLSGIIQTWNKGAEKLYGYTAEEAVGRDVSFLVPPDYPNDVPDILTRIKRGEYLERYETTRMHKNGRRLQVSLEISPIKDSSGAIIGASTIALDITDRKQAEEALRESEARLHKLASTALDAVILIDNSGNVAFWNDAAAKMFGYTSEEILGRYLHSYIMPERHVDAFRKGFEAFQTTGQGPFIGRVYEIEARKKDGSEFPVELSLNSLKLRGAWNAIGIVRDISDRRQLERSLKRSYELTKTIIDSMTEAISLIDVKNLKIVAANDSFLRQYGYSDMSEIAGKHCYEVTHLRQDVCAPPDDMCPLENTVKTGEHCTAEHVHYGKQGEKLFVEISTSPIKDENDEVVQVVHVQRNVTERRRMEEEIRHMALHDPLTGMPNRRLFIDILNVEREQANRHRKKLAVLFLDLDRFKEVNDTLGHEAGDLLLKEAASRLRAAVRKSDAIARIGGDEFNAILADIVHPEDIAAIANKIVEAFRKPFKITGHDILITTSVGISIYPDDSEEIDALLKYADIAMYYAKDNGRNKYQFYNPSINFRSIERMKLERYLRQSVKRGELFVYYQPQVDIRSNKIYYAEALVRWNHPVRGLLEPKEFIPLAEETGFITSIDKWVLKTACNQARIWTAAGIDSFCMTVNLSARQFRDPDLAEMVASVLTETQMAPGCLDIEVTENVAMSNVESSAAQLRKLQKMGVHISIDDFGSGYSSLNYLKKLPIERLKIDKSFIRDIANNADNRAIISAVISMAHKMGIRTVAKGVETEEQLSFVRASECDEAQGFFFSKPLVAEAFEDLVTTRD